MQLRLAGPLTSSLLVLFAISASAQAPNSGATDIYHVHFTKAAPGKGGALGEALKEPDKTSPMPEHFIVLRHQQGDDCDYCLIQHLGPKATLEATRTPPGSGRDLRAWHNDTYVVGPAWPEFVKAMGLGDAAGKSGNSVYAVSVWREAPGHRSQLADVLRNPAPSKVPVSRVLLQHMEGSAWTFLALDRYNSWQDFATDQAAEPSGDDQDAWGRSRAHSTYHHDTLADRTYPR